MASTILLLHSRAVVLFGMAQWFIELRESRQEIAGAPPRLAYDVVQGTTEQEERDIIGPPCGRLQEGFADYAQAVQAFEDLKEAWAAGRPNALVADMTTTKRVDPSPIDGSVLTDVRHFAFARHIQTLTQTRGEAQLFG